MNRMMHARRAHRDRGAAVVEFAIVLPLLLALLFGVVDYGLWFNASISVKQDVANVARIASQLGATGSGCTSRPGMEGVACALRRSLAQTTGADPSRIYTKVFNTGDYWIRGGQVVVCGMVEAKSFTGFVPLPSGGLIRARASMSIESVTPYPTPKDFQDSPPTGENWNWCQA